MVEAARESTKRSSVASRSHSMKRRVIFSGCPYMVDWPGSRIDRIWSCIISNRHEQQAREYIHK